MRLTAAITKEVNWHVAKCLEVEVTSQGHSIEEALENLKEALQLYFEGEPILDPIITPIIASLEVEIQQ